MKEVVLGGLLETYEVAEFPEGQNCFGQGKPVWQ
jgi:hypothetical protein